MQEGPPRRLLHVYGPTEATTFATWFEVKCVVEGAITVPIGHPIANTEVYVLDKSLEPVPVGVPGEIYIGGDGLALGYLKRPDLTAEKFVPHPFHPGANLRLYRTGDLAMLRADGDIEFLGRVDQQVKIRGFRIELAEIAAVLEQHPRLCQAVVVVREEVAAIRRSRGVDIGIQDDGRMAAVAMDRAAFRSVILHLCENAVEACEENVQIRIRHETMHLQIDVVDDGHVNGVSKVGADKELGEPVASW